LPVEARLGVAFKLFDGWGMRGRVYKVKKDYINILGRLKFTVCGGIEVTGKLKRSVDSI